MTRWYSIKEAAKWHSTRAFAFLTTAPLIWASIPDDTIAIIPPTWLPYILAGVAFAGWVGRMRIQGVKQ